MRVAVIGSGASGLTAIKTCKEGGLDVVCYERSDYIGGLWRYREKDEEGLASVAKSTIINSSKELTSYSDFPAPKEFPNYMHNTMMFRYLELYAENFELIPHIKFNHRVERTVPADDYDSTGRWKVTVTNLKTGEKLEENFDAVMICIGHHVFPNSPKFPGQEKFRGKIIHTHSYKTAKEYNDKKVVVIGVGNSGGDAAVEISNVASKVYLSTRTGTWVMHRVGENGIPVDDQMLTRFKNIGFNLVPLGISNWFVERNLNHTFDHEDYQLKPKHRYFQQHPTVNDALPNRILSGTVIVKDNVERFEENGVLFKGDSEVTEIDTVILATGYEIKFPFLDKEIIDTTDNHIELYKFVYPPHMKHPTLAVIGMVQGVGGLFPMFEMQSRWFVQVLKKNVSLPSERQMRSDIDNQLEKMRKRYYNSKRHTIQADYINYLDDIASLIGVKPNFFKMFFTDQELFWALMMGPSLPYQYRLRGPHPWSKARETILSYEHRLTYALQTRYKKQEQEEQRSYFIYFVFIVVIFAVFLSKIM
ncbi:dimethylaniline monooxygenase [N-oxide-forming] 5-like [Centruroides sculpturatus]|uniref:dimethylaniline monooxygenase [N-oxide-forming] 5-like n=1 Tax=Centruroides sculpturatus TaxID=218467 RepID=UPI000C6E4487|nr:dimethylaniline monooxygenase [N-oxide-forming] 5-like [Centruroides sculpturatus]